MFFIYLEIMQMVSIFFSSGKIPIRYPLYISMFSLARHISFENLVGIDALYLSGSIALIAGALVGLGYRDKLLNHKLSKRNLSAKSWSSSLQGDVKKRLAKNIIKEFDDLELDTKYLIKQRNVFQF